MIVVLFFVLEHIHIQDVLKEMNNIALFTDDSAVFAHTVVLLNLDLLVDLPTLESEFANPGS